MSGGRDEARAYLAPVPVALLRARPALADLPEALERLGVCAGDRVAYIAPNTHAQLESFYAVPQMGAVLVPINYRLAPADKFPVQIDDVETAYRWLLDQGYDPSRIASTGDSIGGNYAVNLALTLQRKNAPLPGAVLSRL